MTKYIDKWKQLSLLAKIAYILVGTLFIIIPIELMIEALGNPIIGMDILEKWYILAIVTSLLAKKWKLAIITFVGGILVYSFMIGMAEFVGWYFNIAYGIDISGR